MRIACWIHKATNTHSEYVHTYCFSTATMVSRTCHNVTLYVHCLYCWVLNCVLSPRRAGFDSGLVHVGFVVNKVTLWQVFLLVLRFSSVTIFLAVPHTHSSTCCSYQKDKRAKSGNLTKSNALYKPLSTLPRNSDFQRTSKDKHQPCQIWGPSLQCVRRVMICRVRGYLLASSLHCQISSSALGTAR